MKFGKRLTEDLTYPGWEDVMIPYKLLKNIIRDQDAVLFLDTLLGAKAKARLFLKEHHKSLETESIELLERMRSLPSESDTASEALLSRFVVWLDEIQALREFSLTSQVAIEKIVKKFMRHVSEENCNSSTREAIAKLRFSDDGDGKNENHLFGVLVTELDRLIQKGHDVCSVMRLKDTRQFDVLRDLQASYSAWIEKRIQKRTERLEKEKYRPRPRSLTPPIPFRGLIKTIVDANGERIVKRVEPSQSLMGTFVVYDVLKPEFALLTSIMLPIITFFVTYSRSASIFVDMEKSKTPFDIKGYFLSASFDHAPASCYGAQGLSLTVFCLSVVIMIQHKLVKGRLKGKWGFRHRVSLGFGLFSCWAAIGVASWQHQHSAVTHNTYAVLFFVSGVAHICMETTIDRYFQLSNPNVTRFRILLSVLTMLCCGVFVVYAYLGSHSKKVKLSGQKDFRLLFVSAIAEIMMFLGLLSFFITYIPSFLECELELKVRPRKRFQEKIPAAAMLKEA